MDLNTQTVGCMALALAAELNYWGDEALHHAKDTLEPLGAGRTAVFDLGPGDLVQTPDPIRKLLVLSEPFLDEAEIAFQGVDFEITGDDGGLYTEHARPIDVANLGTEVVYRDGTLKPFPGGFMYSDEERVRVRDFSRYVDWINDVIQG